MCTLLLLSVVGADLVDGRPFVAQQRDFLGDLVQFVNTAEPILVPEQEVLIVAQAEGVVQLLPFIHRLTNQRTALYHRFVLQRLEAPGSALLFLIPLSCATHHF